MSNNTQSNVKQFSLHQGIFLSSYLETGSNKSRSHIDQSCFSKTMIDHFKMSEASSEVQTSANTQHVSY